MTERERNLVLSNLPLIERRCRNIARRHHQRYDDVLRHGYYAACRLAMNYRTDQIPFHVFLQRFLRERIIDAGRLEEGRGGRKFRRHVVALDDQDLEQRGTTDDVTLIEVIDVLRRSELSERNAELVGRHLLLNETFASLGTRYGITEAACCLAFGRAMKQLRQLEERNL